jgi:calcineurin-like phosphoesterase family protein
MNYWIIADTHFSHNNIIKYCNRPENFNELLLENLKIIKNDDILIHLGDFSFNRKYDIIFKENYKFRKILIKGNHDRNSDIWYMQNGWDFVCKSFQLNKYGIKLLFSHNLTKPINDDVLNIHGHVHINENLKWDQHYILISVEYLNYKPILLDKVIQMWQNKKTLKTVNF